LLTPAMPRESGILLLRCPRRQWRPAPTG
jgi:hypothetical protein